MPRPRAPKKVFASIDISPPPTQTYKCWQCRKQRPDDSKAVYSTFADDSGSSVGDPNWRICPKCVNENHNSNRRLFLFIFAFAGCLWLFTHLMPTPTPTPTLINA